MDLLPRTHEGSSTTLAGSYRAELHPTGGETGKITKHISWHVFRHAFSTLLAGNDEDVKTVQSLMRHANSITMKIYTQAVGRKKRRVQDKVVGMILREEKTTPVAGGVG